MNTKKNKNKYHQLVDSFTSKKNQVSFPLPSFFDSALSYISAVDPVGMVSSDKTLFNKASMERREFTKSFKVTDLDYISSFLNINNSEKLLKLLLDTIFEYNCMYDAEIGRRYKELKLFVSKFEEVMPNIFLYNDVATVVVAFICEGVFVRYNKKPNFHHIQLEGDVDDRDIYLVNADGSIDAICEYGVFSEDFGCRRVDVVLREKNYRMVTFNDRQGGMVCFRSHTLLFALAYGVDLAKHTLGRFGALTLDHINKDACDNRLMNKRLVTRQDNDVLKNDLSYPAFDFTKLSRMNKKILRNSVGAPVREAALIG